MASNPYVNKVVYGNSTVMDISDTDTQESDVAEGKVFYKGSGARSVGTGNYYSPSDTAETTIDDADYFPFYDSSATAKRKTLWSNIKAKLKTYFDTLYLSLSNKDDWTSAATATTVGSDTVLVFDNLNDSYGYALHGIDEWIQYTSVTESTGTTSGTKKLTFVLDGATVGVTQGKLRILK